MDQNNNFKKSLKGTLFALISFISLSIIFILSSPLLILLLKDSAQIVSAMGPIILLIASIAGGAVCSHYTKNVFYSLIPSLPTILLILTGSAFFKESSLSIGAVIGLYAAIPIAFFIGGSVIYFISQRRPRRRKRYR